MIILYLLRLLREFFIQRKKLKRAAVPVNKRTKMKMLILKKKQKNWQNSQPLWLSEQNAKVEMWHALGSLFTYCSVLLPAKNRVDELPQDGNECVRECEFVWECVLCMQVCYTVLRCCNFKQHTCNVCYDIKCDVFNYFSSKRYSFFLTTIMVADVITWDSWLNYLVDFNMTAQPHTT